jgi:hypothetical protein
MSKVNPAGNMFLDLIEELMGLLKNANASKIKVVMASYERDEHGKNKVVSGKHSIATRGFEITGMDKEVQENLRTEYEAGPLTNLMILWMERCPDENKLRIVRFGPDTKPTSPGGPVYDAVEQDAISHYLRKPAK